MTALPRARRPGAVAARGRVAPHPRPRPAGDAAADAAGADTAVDGLVLVDTAAVRAPGIADEGV